MKIEELMLGDYVRDKYGHFVKVNEIYSDSIFTEDGEYEGEQLMVGEFEPIPLTPEILEKNGFGYVEKDTLMGITHFYLGEPYYCENMNLHIGGDDNGVFWLNYLRNDIWSIRYVHQLQHALRICGIEKEINVN